MPINWKDIKPYHNSQNNAFEELVCQLAREEKIVSCKEFIRVGAPDGGVEAYWVLSNGSEYGWQAKYFDVMGVSQWKQLDDSFQKAFTTHPNLIKYFICLPLDRQDPRIPKKKHFKQKWDLKIAQWRLFAKSKGRNIDFEYWGNSELLNRLSLEKHAGRKYFWFTKEEFSDEWFKDKLIKSISDLEERYTPELNFELDISKKFQGLARDEYFEKQLFDSFIEVKKTAKGAVEILRDKKLLRFQEEIKNEYSQLLISYDEISFKEIKPINSDGIIQICDNIFNIIENCSKKIRELEEEYYKSKGIKEPEIHYSESDKFRNEKYELRKLLNTVFDFRSIVNDKVVLLANTPILILTGDAGVGKSHLLADIATKRSEENKPTLLIPGQYFSNRDLPWTQLLRNILRLSCNEDEFLGALNAKGQSTGARVLIFIDAINEGEGKYIWKNTLISFLKCFEKYRYVGLVLSVRSSYEKLIVSDSIYKKSLAQKLVHKGFEDVEYAASKYFFKNYEIEQPSIPLLHPEFQNPLFLKIFCDGLKKAGLHKIPEGYSGISTIIDFYINAINTKISAPDRLDYNKSVNLVRKAVNEVIKVFVDKNKDYLTYEEACEVIEKVKQPWISHRMLTDEIISEGLLSKNLLWEKLNPTEVIYFNYERFKDHLSADYLINKHLNISNPKKSFYKREYLYTLFENESKCYHNKGLLEALSVQLPEKTGAEFFELLPHSKDFYPVIESFVESLIWRQTSTMNDKLIPYINKQVNKHKGTKERFLETTLLVTSNNKHFFNADFLHKNLIRFSLSERDAWWSIFIDNNHSSSGAVKRLIDWSWSLEDKSYVEDDSIRLLSKTISWFLTSSNRYLRDYSTKALICLLQNRILVLLKILIDFKEVNDPYILERLYAVTYGCLLRTNSTEGIKELAEYVYNTIFTNKKVYPHILLRDYARNIIDFAIYLKLNPVVDNRYLPPYKSSFPKKFPTLRTIDKFKLEYKSKDFRDYYWSQNHILDSMTTEYGRGTAMYGDFGRYVFQSGLHNWPQVDPNKLSNWAVKKVFELGYDVDKHGTHDRNIAQYLRDGRTGHKAERIGKKYQWLAYHEILARVADNYKMRDPWSWQKDKLVNYDGSWEPFIRDIDPTTLIKETKEERYSPVTMNWWFNITYKNWEMSNLDWLKTDSDLPDMKNIVKIDTPSGEEWFNLNLYPSWEEPIDPSLERWSTPHKELKYDIRSFIVSNDDLKILKNAFKIDPRVLGEFPGVRDISELFYREYYWSPGYHSILTEKVGTIKLGKQTIKFINPMLSFLWEEPYDCSKEDAFRIYMPSGILYKEMDMKYSDNDGCFLNSQNELICFDPSVHEKSLSCLLIKKKELLQYLSKNNYTIIWTLYGEKSIIGNTPSKYYSGRLETIGLYFYNKGKVLGSKQSKFITR